jgi:hypothetical protein
LLYPQFAPYSALATEENGQVINNSNV